MTSRNHVAAVGAHVANFINALVSNGLSGWARINVIGHSLGSHVAGNVGKRTTSRVQAIFGTDPAGPLFNANSADRLAAGDAVYTEALHTNAGTLGFDAPITTSSFYPNWVIDIFLNIYVSKIINLKNAFFLFRGRHNRAAVLTQLELVLMNVQICKLLTNQQMKFSR